MSVLDVISRRLYMSKIADRIGSRYDAILELVAMIFENFEI